MSSQKRTTEEIDADLDALKLAVARGERELDAEAMAEGFALVLERFGIVIKFGLAGALEALNNFIEMLLGPVLKKLAALGEKGQEIVEKLIMQLLAKIMFFIMLIMSFATFGVIPAPPNLEVVLFFYEWLRSVFDLKKELEEEETTGDTPEGSGGNIL